MIQKTKDYTIFKYHAGNRPIDPLNVKKIKQSLKLNNMLELRPILVNEDMQIIDGQHRLHAAMELLLDVFYIIQKDTQPVDIVLLNSAQKQWATKDYVRFYASQGKEAYLDVERLMKRHDITYQEFAILSGTSGGKNNEAIKQGTFEFDLEEKTKQIQERLGFIRQIIQFIEEKAIGNKAYLLSVAFKKGVCYIMNHARFSQEVFLTKLSLNIQKFTHCTTIQQYVDMMIGIYNYRNNDPL